MEQPTEPIKKRYWSRGEGLVALDQEGFLLDPDDKDQIYNKTEVVSFDEINNTNCLILLGEPGVGKSQAVQHEYSRLLKQDVNSLIIFHDISEFGDENRLIEELFKSKFFQNWINSDKILTMFIDGYDQCLLGIGNLPALLESQFKKIETFVDRLRLRISCRSGLWSEGLTKSLTKIYGPNSFGIFQIAPLRKVDVTNIALNHSIDDKLFIAEVINKSIQALAINPTTLNSLINEFKLHNRLIHSREKFFHRSCKELCQEPNYDRFFMSKERELSAEKCVAIASRIAAVMIFCNKKLVDISNVDSWDENIISLSDLQEGDEIADKYSFSFDQKSIKTVLTSSGLFSRKGEFLFGFSHLSFTEFLAAKFVTNHQLEVEQIKSLITISSDDEGKIVPQVKGTASWLSIISPPLTEYTIEKDPQNLLNADVENLNEESIKKLVESLYNKFNNNDIDDYDWGLHKQYKKLKHSNLSNQIGEFISSPGNPIAKRFAIDLAIECELIELGKSILDVALDIKENGHVRTRAINALKDLGSKRINKKLHSLLNNKNQVIDDEMKGSILNVLWPDILSTKNVFSYLTAPRNRFSFGSYKAFLFSFIYQLKKEDINHGLEWILKQSRRERGDQDFSFEEIKSAVVYQAWIALKSHVKMDLLAKVLVERLKNHEAIFPIPSRTERFKVTWDDISKNKSSRYQVLDALIEELDLKDTYLAAHSQLVFPSDFQEIAQMCQAELSDERKKKLSKILSYLFDVTDVDCVRIILDMSYSDAFILKEFEYWITAIEIKSKKAENQKKNWEQQKKWKKEGSRRQNDGLTKVAIHKRLIKDLYEYESENNPIVFNQFFLDLTLGENSTHYGNELTSNPLELPGWELLSNDQIKHVRELAKTYINTHNEDFQKWFGTDLYHRPAACGYKSLMILWKLDGQFVKNLPAEIWNNWVHILLSYPESYGIAGQDEDYLKVIEYAYTRIPNEILQVLQQIFENARDGEQEHLTILHKFQRIYDSKVEKKLLKLVNHGKLPTSLLNYILQFLLSRKSDRANKLIQTLIKKSNGDLQVALLRSFANSCNADGWSFVTRIIYKDEKIGEEFFLSFVDSYAVNMSPLLDRIDENQASDLFLWLINKFPREEDPKIEGAHAVGARESVGHFRDQILRYLSNKGTRESVQALEKIQNILSYMNLDYYLIEARRQFRRVNWKPLRPDEFLLLAQNKNARVVFNEEDLLELIEGSLKELERVLQDDNSLSITLWDRVHSKGGKYKPKPEEILSDVVKRQLDQDLKSKGISSYREVQLRRPNTIKGGRQGERTDILVSFFNPSTEESISVIIEVKGSNNKEVNTNMKTQLRDRYLKNGGFNHGLYLVGWYNCDAYHYQKNHIKLDTINEARNHFAKQAMILETEQKKIKSFVLDCALQN